MKSPLPLNEAELKLLDDLVWQKIEANRKNGLSDHSESSEQIWLVHRTILKFLREVPQGEAISAGAVSESTFSSHGWKSREPKKADGDLTKREYFAARAMGAVIDRFMQNGYSIDPDVPSGQKVLKQVAKCSVAAADALMRELGDGEQLNASLVRSAKSALKLLEQCGVQVETLSPLAALRDAVEAAKQGESEEVPLCILCRTKPSVQGINGACEQCAGEFQRKSEGRAS